MSLLRKICNKVNPFHLVLLCILLQTFYKGANRTCNFIVPVEGSSNKLVGGIGFDLVEITLGNDGQASFRPLCEFGGQYPDLIATNDGKVDSEGRYMKKPCFR